MGAHLDRRGDQGILWPWGGEWHWMGGGWDGLLCGCPFLEWLEDKSWHENKAVEASAPVSACFVPSGEGVLPWRQGRSWCSQPLPSPQKEGGLSLGCLGLGQARTGHFGLSPSLVAEVLLLGVPALGGLRCTVTREGLAEGPVSWRAPAPGMVFGPRQEPTTPP